MATGEKLSRNLFYTIHKSKHTVAKSPNRFENSNGCRAYLTNGHMNLYVDTPEAVSWEKTMTVEQERQRKRNIPTF